MPVLLFALGLCLTLCTGAWAPPRIDVTFAWNANTDTVTVGYLLKVKPNQELTWTPRDSTHARDDTTLTLNLRRDLYWEIHVVAFDRTGQQSLPSNVVVLPPWPRPPKNLKAKKPK